MKVENPRAKSAGLGGWSKVKMDKSKCREAKAISTVPQDPTPIYDIILLLKIRLLELLYSSEYFLYHITFIIRKTRIFFPFLGSPNLCCGSRL